MDSTTIYAIVFDAKLGQFNLSEVVLGGKITGWNDDLLAVLLRTLAKNSEPWERILHEDNMAFIFNADTKEGCHINVLSFLEKYNINKR